MLFGCHALSLVQDIQDFACAHTNVNVYDEQTTKKYLKRTKTETWKKENVDDALK